MRGKILAVCLTVMLVAPLLVGACAEPAPEEVEAPTREWLVGWSPLGYAMNIGRRTTDEGIIRGVEEAGGKVIYISPALAGEGVGDAATQAAAVDTFIAAGCDAIGVYACDSEALIPSIKKANAAGIPFFFCLTSMPKGVDVDILLTGDLEYEEGSHLAAQTIVDALIEKYGEPRGLVLEMLGVMTMSVAIKRSEYFHDVIDQYPNIEVVSKEGGDDMAQCSVAVEDWFTAHPETDAIYFFTTFVGLPPTIEVLNKIGRWQKIGHPDHVIMAGHDPPAAGLYCIKSGYVEMTYGNALGHTAYALSKVVMEYLETGVRPKVGDKYEVGIPGFETVEIVDDPDNLGPTLVLQGFAATQENCDHPSLFGNALQEEPNGLTEPGTMDWW